MDPDQTAPYIFHQYANSMDPDQTAPYSINMQTVWTQMIDCSLFNRYANSMDPDQTAPYSIDMQTVWTQIRLLLMEQFDRSDCSLWSSLIWVYTDCLGAQWLSGRVLDSTEGPQVRASPASLHCGPWARHIYPSLVLVQPRKTCPCLTERLLMGCKESNQTNKNQILSLTLNQPMSHHAPRCSFSHQNNLIFLPSICKQYGPSLDPDQTAPYSIDMQTVWTQIRLLLMEQSDLGLHWLLQKLPKNM